MTGWSSRPPGVVLNGTSLGSNVQAIFEECETNAKIVPIVTRPNGLSKTQNVLDCIHISFIVKRVFFFKKKKLD